MRSKTSFRMASPLSPDSDRPPLWPVNIGCCIPASKLHGRSMPTLPDDLAVGGGQPGEMLKSSEHHGRQTADVGTRTQRTIVASRRVRKVVPRATRVTPRRPRSRELP